MQYAGPLDQPGFPNADYVDGNPAAGVQGSIVPAAAVENPQREIVQTIADCLLSAPSNLDLTQLSSAVRFMRAQYAIDVGTTNLLAITLSPAPVQWVTPLMFYVLIGHTNTSTVVNIQIAGLTGQKQVVKRDGTSVAVGDLVEASIVLMAFDGNAMRCLSALASDVGASAAVSGAASTFNLQVFTSSGTYTPTAGSTKGLVFCTGGGAAGQYDCGGGGGGGAGATAITMVNLSGTVTVTIGAGGLSEAPPGPYTHSGGQSSFGTFAVAGGGNYGQSSPPAAVPNGGIGGVATAGLIQIGGGAGGFYPGNIGGASFWGGGGLGMVGTGNGGDAIAPGAGGGGTYFGGPYTGAGANGICMILEL